MAASFKLTAPMSKPMLMLMEYQALCQTLTLSYLEPTV